MRSRARRIFFPLVILVTIPLSARAQQPNATATIDLPPEFARVLRDYETAWRARDAQRLAALFHADGFVLSSGSPPARGRDAIARHYGNAGGNLYLHAVSYAAADTIGYIVGLYGSTPSDRGGKFVLALRRANARQPWLIAADMDNRNSRE
jgi:hypothetical protein